MSYSGLLIHTVEVYRRSGATDRFGQEKSQNPRQHTVSGESLVASYPCRVYGKSGGLAFAERAVDTFEREFVMFTEVGGVDIHEDDAVRVIDANGHVLIGLAKVKDSNVIYQYGQEHHCEFLIWEQSGPGSVF